MSSLHERSGERRDELDGKRLEVLQADEEKFEPLLLPENTLDEFYLSEEGKAMIDRFTAIFDQVTSEVGYVQRSLSGQVENQSTLISVMFSEPQQLGLVRPPLIDAAMKNPALLTAQRRAGKLHYDGDFEGQKAYTRLRIVLLHLMRAEMLHGEYDGTSDVWQGRQSRIGFYHGRTMSLHLGPGIRTRDIPRRSSPSDELYRRLK